MPEENKGSAQTQDPGNQKTDTEAKQAYQAKKQQNTSDTLPKVNMNTFLLSLSSSAMVHLGEVPEPESGTTSTNLSMARHTIDILGMLEEKTQGNLTSDEEDLLKNILFELRMKYVQKTS
ncbi:MAG: DUF1844 domain-containing protein [Thermodesulfobacteriota bacterium]